MQTPRTCIPEFQCIGVGDHKRRARFRTASANDLHHVRLIVGIQNTRRTRLDDTRLLFCDCDKCITKQFGVIVIHTHNDRQQRCNHIRRVIRAADSYLQHNKIAGMPCKIKKSHHGHQLKLQRRLSRLGCVTIHKRSQFFTDSADLLLGNLFPVNFHAFAEFHDEGRDKPSDTVSLCTERRGQKGACRAFAVGTGHMQKTP